MGYIWKSRKISCECPPTDHRLQLVNTLEQEAVVLYRRLTLLSLQDDLKAVVRDIVCPNVSSSGMERHLLSPGAGSLNYGKLGLEQSARGARGSYDTAMRIRM
jgi:hypothetical protein